MAAEQVSLYFPSVVQIVQSNVYDFANDLRASIRDLLTPDNIVTLKGEVTPPPSPPPLTLSTATNTHTAIHPTLVSLQLSHVSALSRIGYGTVPR